MCNLQSTEGEETDDDKALFQRHLCFPDEGDGENEDCKIHSDVEGGVDGVELLLLDAVAAVDGGVPEEGDRMAAEGSRG